jgi:DNA-directed RNA polymerase specialized sigma24 family protein
MSTTTMTRPQRRDIGAGEALEALRAGDEAAFAALVDECRPALLRVAGALTPTRADAEAAVRGAWLDVLHGLDEFDGRSAVRAWAMRLLADRVAGDLRSRRSRPARRRSPRIGSCPPAAWRPRATGRRHRRRGTAPARHPRRERTPSRCGRGAPARRADRPSRCGT